MERSITALLGIAYFELSAFYSPFRHLFPSSSLPTPSFRFVLEETMCLPFCTLCGFIDLEKSLHNHLFHKQKTPSLSDNLLFRSYSVYLIVPLSPCCIPFQLFHLLFKMEVYEGIKKCRQTLAVIENIMMISVICFPNS